MCPMSYSTLNGLIATVCTLCVIGCRRLDRYIVNYFLYCRRIVVVRWGCRCRCCFHNLKKKYKLKKPIFYVTVEYCQENCCVRFFFVFLLFQMPATSTALAPLSQKCDARHREFLVLLLVQFCFSSTNESFTYIF